MIQKKNVSEKAHFLFCRPHFWDLPDDPLEIDLKDYERRITEGCCAADQTRINVGDRVYLLGMCEGKTRFYGKPIGIIAAGRSIAAPEEKQLKQKGDQYSHLSETYVDCFKDFYLEDDYSGFASADLKKRYFKEYSVCIKFDSYVKIDVPLSAEVLQQLPPFRGYVSHPQLWNSYFLVIVGAWHRFIPDDPTKFKALDSAWEAHTLAQQEKGKGYRFIDFYLKKGEQLLAEEDYWLAKVCYEQALEIQPSHEQAIYKLETCQSRIKQEECTIVLKQTSFVEKADPEITVSPDLFNVSNLQTELDRIRDELDQQEPQFSLDAKEARNLILTEIARRRGQKKFRQTLLEAYSYRCAITGCDAGEALEAAHIIPYVETANNEPKNGLLLRADLHTLFDLNLLAIEPIKPDTLKVFLHPDLLKTEYHDLHKKLVKIPAEVALRPDPVLLERRLKQCDWYPQVKIQLQEN